MDAAPSEPGRPVGLDRRAFLGGLVAACAGCLVAGCAGAAAPPSGAGPTGAATSPSPTLSGPARPSARSTTPARTPRSPAPESLPSSSGGSASSQSAPTQTSGPSPTRADPTPSQQSPSPGPTRSSPRPTSSPTPTATSSVALVRVADVPVGGGVILDSFALVVTQPVAGQIRGFENRCTHAACSVNEIAAGEIRCPCHSSRFAVADGSVLAGPAPRALPTVELRVVDGVVYFA